MRAIGLDIGHRRIGIAVEDGLGLTAQPAGTHWRTSLQEDLEALGALCHKLGATHIVAGLPKTLSGEVGQQAQQAMEFANQLAEKTGLPVTFWDERFSSREAERVLIEGGVSRKKRKGRVDCLAACIILQGYMDNRKGNVHG
nr:Holliday junction resolvase RuvX [bacterium]